MRTLVRIVAGIAVVLAIVVVGLIVAIKTIDPNTLIAPVQAQVKAATGRDLAVRGGAHIALSLHPRIVLTDVVLSNAPWGTAKELARIERLELAAALVPLLSRRFELEEIVLVKPVVALETDGKGRKNWQSGSAPVSPASPGGGSNLAAAVAIGSVTVTDGVFTYQDGPKAAASRLTVDKLVLHSRALRSGVDVDFRGAFGETPLAVEGAIGSLETLLERTSPFPIDVKGQVAGQAFAVATKIRAEASRYSFDELKLSLGANAIAGSLSVDTGGPRPKLVFDFKAPALALAAIPVPATNPSAAPPPATGAAGRAYVIPNTPVSFAPLRLADADGKLAIGKLALASGQTMTDVQVALTNADARLDVRSFSLGAFGGTLRGSLSVDASGDTPALKVRVDGSGLSLGAILTAAGYPREVKGGTTEVAADLAMRGHSPHEWAGSATGSVRAVAGRATLVNSRLDTAVALDNLVAAVNPFRTRDPSTELQCAVVRFPVANGVARVDRSIAAETDKLGVSASGTLDFREETLDLQINPKVRRGISIDLASIADLVRVTGPFASPRVAIDPAGSAKVIASVGAAIGTSGLSAVAQGLLSWADGSGPGPCQVALEGPAARGATPQSAGQQPQVPIANEVGKALGRLFGR